LTATVSCASPFSPQSSAITDRFFANPAVEPLTTPAFRKSGGFTKHEEMVTFLHQLLADHSDVARLETLGLSQRGRPILAVYFGVETSSTTEPIRVWMQGGLHGNEPASTEGLLVLLQRLLSDPQKRALLDRVQLAVVPMANPDGYDRQIRPSSNGLDLNRDQTKLLAPESRILKAGFYAFDPHVAVDFHEYRPYRRDFIRFGKWGITQIFDVMFLYTGNLNVPAPLRAHIQDVYVARAREVVEGHGLRSHDYVTTRKVFGEVQFNQGSVNARASATNFALANTVASLIEVRGVALGRDGFVRRVMTTYWVARSYLETAMEMAEKTQAVLAKSRRHAGPVVVRSKRKVEPGKLSTIDVATAQEIEIDVTIRNALASEPTLVRPRPFAYLLLPQAEAQADRLRILGLEVDQLSESTLLDVERYLVEKCVRDPYSYEGTVPQRVRTELSDVTRSFPPGTFVVRMDQKRANLAAEVLEPETNNGFVGFGVLEAREGRELPIYRRLEAFEIE
jgi:hypothetical protein